MLFSFNAPEAEQELGVCVREEERHPWVLWYSTIGTVM